MNIREINGLINDLRDNLGDACLSSAIISYDTGASIASDNMDDKSSALLSKYTTFMVEMIEKAQVDGKISYYAMKLPGSMMTFNLVFKGYCWFTVVNTAQVPLGMIMNGVLPECIENFQVVMA